jgi:hypothetical protein
MTIHSFQRAQNDIRSEYNARGLVMYARELASHLRERGIRITNEALAWARERNSAVGWAGYNADQHVTQVHLDYDALFLIVGLAVTLRDNPAFYDELLGYKHLWES